MKLRNKKTGEIGYPQPYGTDEEGRIWIWVDNVSKPEYRYDSLAKLYAEWEDVPEEPKEHWAIDQFGEPINVSGLSRLQLEKLHRLGNDFPSENATMKAIAKLKAWKRLKDKGFRFCGHDDRDRGQLGDIVIYAEMPTFEYDDDSTRDDLDLLFGGEE